MKTHNKKLNIDPFYGNILMLSTLVVIIIILIKRYFQHLKGKNEFHVIKKNEKVENKQRTAQDSIKIKSKKIHTTLKPSFQKVEKKEEEISTVVNTSLDSDSEDKVKLESQESKSTEGAQEKKNIKFKNEKKKLKKQMNEEEKENLFNLLSFLCKEYENDKDSSLLNIDNLFEIKYNNDDFVMVEEFNLEFNQKILNAFRVNVQLDELKNILIIYKDSCTKKINLNFNTLLNLFKLFLKFEVFDYSLYFLCEMETLNFSIPKNIMEIIRELPKVKKIRVNKVENFIYFQKSNDKIRKNIINPMTSFYLRSPNYFYYKSKKESYLNFDTKKIFNILELAQIKINDEVPNTTITNKAIPNTAIPNSKEINIINSQILAKTRSQSDAYNIYNTKSKLEEITRGQIKEYVPKHFRISLKK